MYAIQNKRTGRFVTGTNFKKVISNKDGFIHKQLTSSHRAIFYDSDLEAFQDRKKRKCNKNFIVVEVVPRIDVIQEMPESNLLKGWEYD